MSLHVSDVQREIDVFQSHYGLILSSVTAFLQDCVVEDTFNPTMVWFYRFISEPQCGHLLVFQSHYGLILSSFVQELPDYEQLLSIPLWSDFILVL